MKKTCLTIGILLCGLMAFQHMLPYKKISPEQINIAVQKSLHRLEYSSHDFLANAGGCHSCHGQALGSIAFFMANDKGFNVSKPEWQEAIDSMSNSIHRNRSAYIECTDPVALAIGRGYDLWALSVNQVKPNKDIHLLVRDLMTRQSLNGSWASPSSRPPMEGSTYTATAFEAGGIYATDASTLLTSDTDFTITVTSITDTDVRGTFSGKIDAKVVSEGAFSAKFQ